MSRTAVTKYEGPPPGSGVKMTEEDAARLRAQVPDDPIKLPPGHLACEACGIAVPTLQAVSSVMPPNTGQRPVATLPFARCANCQGAHDTAAGYATAHPALAARLGPDIARERVESVLFGLTILGQPVPADLALLLPRLHPAAHGVRFANPLTLTRDLCSPRPWAHVTTAQRVVLRKAYADSLRDRLALSAPPVAVRCPSLGCLFCGVASMERAALEVVRRGGLEAAAHSIWTRRITSPKALGGRGPNLIDGHVCPDCARAIEDRGAVGWRARAQAVVSYLSRIGEDKKADRLRREVEGDFPPMLPAWGALSLRPNKTPWVHLRRVIDRL